VSGRRRLLVACAAAVLVLAPVGFLWWSSLLPGSLSVMEMGYVDRGGVTGPAGHDGHGGPGVPGPATSTRGAGDVVDVTSLTADPDRPPDVEVTLTARAERFELASGRTVDGYTLNGGSPGPLIEATEGQLVQVRLVNESVPDGITLHWHGVDVPNAEDGVAGVTQDAVAAGQEHTYRFVAEQVGTFWYHSHQVSHEQVRRGLLGPLVIRPAAPDAARQDAAVEDVVALSHTYDGARTLNGRQGDVRVEAAPGQQARVRLVNTDNGAMPVWVTGAPYRVLAVDGTDLAGPTDVDGQYLLVTAGGRADLGVTLPADGGAVRVQVAGSTSVVLGPDGADVPPVRQPKAALDLLAYGTPGELGFDASAPDRTFEYSIGRRPGFVDGRPGMFWTVNGHLYPDLPMFEVAEGDVVRMRIENHSGQPHPMHLHGHHVVVLSRDGTPSTGSPWWVDSLEVANGDSYDVAFVADNPGIWMDHCHNLPHAQQGLVAHLMYAGVSTPFTLGGPASNAPE